jgi:hypothetical protein
MANLGDFRTVVSSKTGMNNTIGSGDRSLMELWANEGVRDVLIRTHCFVDFGTMTTSANEGNYDLPTPILSVKKLQIRDLNGDPTELRRVSVEEIFDYRERVTAASTQLPSRYSVQGSNMLLLSPTPNSTYTINVYFVPLPTELVEDTDSPSVQEFGGIATPYHKAIEYYMLWQAGDHTDDQSSAQGERYKQLYEQMISLIRGHNIRMGGPSVPPFRIPGYISISPRDPSTDLGY